MAKTVQSAPIQGPIGDRLVITWQSDIHDGNSDIAKESPLVLYRDGRVDFTPLIDNNSPWHVIFGVRFSDGDVMSIPDQNYRLVHSQQILQLCFRGGAKLDLVASAT